MCKYFGFYGFAKSDLYEMAFTKFSISLLVTHIYTQIEHEACYTGTEFNTNFLQAFKKKLEWISYRFKFLLFYLFQNAKESTLESRLTFTHLVSFRISQGLIILVKIVFCFKYDNFITCL